MESAIKYNGNAGVPAVITGIGTDDLFAGPLSGFANEMVQTGWGAHPIIGQREGGRGMPTWVARGIDHRYATPEDVAKAVSGHGHAPYEDAIRRLAEGLGGLQGAGERAARDGGSYAGREEAEAEMRAYVDDLSGFILGYSTGKQFDLGDAPIDIMSPMVRPSLKRGWEYAKDPGLGADFTRAVHTYLLERRVVSGSRR